MPLALKRASDLLSPYVGENERHIASAFRQARDVTAGCKLTRFFACGVSAQDVEHIAPAILPACFFFERSPDT